MDAVKVLSFLIHPLDERPTPLALTPVLDGIPLTDLIHDFEKKHNYEPVRGYGGLVPEHYSFGPLERYFMGEADMEGRDERYYLLGCPCGEVGCWPLTARIVRAEDCVVWDSFRQPHRRERDYSTFGPFSFDVQQYKTVVEGLSSQFGGAPSK